MNRSVRLVLLLATFLADQRFTLGQNLSEPDVRRAAMTYLKTHQMDSSDKVIDDGIYFPEQHHWIVLVRSRKQGVPTFSLVIDETNPQQVTLQKGH